MADSEVISTPVAAWNFLITDLRASSGGMRKSLSYLWNSLPISSSFASGHSCFTTAIWFAYVVRSLITLTRIRDGAPRLFQPTIHCGRNAPDMTLLGKRLSMRVGEDSAPHYLRRQHFESAVFERAHENLGPPTAFSLDTLAHCQWSTQRFVDSVC